MIQEENPAIEAELMGELELPSGFTYEVGLGSLVNSDNRVPRKANSPLPEGPWRLVHLRAKGKGVWLRGYSSGFLFVVGHSERPDAGSDLFPVLTRAHVRKILEIAGVPTGRVEG